MRPNQLTDLFDLWQLLLGDPVPDTTQFQLWAVTHAPETIKHAIMKTCRKNLQLGGTMDQDYKIRFASKVMLTKTNDPQKAEGQRPRTPDAKQDDSIYTKEVL